jgi:hypothetical protein
MADPRRYAAIAVTVIVALHAALMLKVAATEEPLAMVALSLVVDAIVVAAVWWFASRKRAPSPEASKGAWAVAIFGALVVLACLAPLLFLIYFLRLAGGLWGGS